MRSNLNRDFAAIVRRAGIPWCTPHDLGETCASRLANAGFNQRVVQEVLGHKSASTTSRYYTKVEPETVARAAELLGRKVG